MLRGGGGWKLSGDFIRTCKGEAAVEVVLSGPMGDGMAASGAFVETVHSSVSLTS